MLKLKLDQTTYDTLPPAIKAEYKADASGGFILDTDVPIEDTAALKNALLSEKAARKTATEAKQVLETQVTQLSGENDTLKARALKPSELEAAWQKKLDDANAANKVKQESLTGSIKTMLVDNVALQIASEIGTAPDLLMPHLKSRLTAVEEDGQWLTRTLDGEGKVSAQSVKELQQEFVASQKFAPIIKGSQASGGGAAGGKLPAGGKKFGDMNEGERTALYRSNPAEYKRQSALDKGAAAQT